jgi:hypothetical protein
VADEVVVLDVLLLHLLHKALLEAVVEVVDIVSLQ